MAVHFRTVQYPFARWLTLHSLPAYPSMTPQARCLYRCFTSLPSLMLSTSPKPPQTTTALPALAQSSAAQSHAEDRGMALWQCLQVSSVSPHVHRIPCSSNGALGCHSVNRFVPHLHAQDVDYIPPPTDNRRTTTFAISSPVTSWKGNGDMDLENRRSHRRRRSRGGVQAA
ncbi:hypothetical protein JB92DRAFT_3105806 [Gautieria morchelliformis]|nr:hypothetical protein JB92DRAFT_3105806 [Gautieria morchelliformis]